ncbi:MAG: ATP-binding protein [Phycisphaerae bacterium]|nr:ATP-binding protein [Phycisphaerae bacterium]MDD5381363.1 ATP-binding protein [Phycisphaerae bacterium]
MLTKIIEKRLSLHKNLASQQQQNDVLQSQLTALQALANIGTVTCMVAHEINNLLTPLTNFAALALKNPDDKPLSEKALQKVVHNCERASKIMESMLAVANGQSQEKKNTALITLVEDIFGCLCRDFAKDGITVNIQIPQDLAVWVVPVQIQQVLMNLILNARDAMLSRGGVLTIKVWESSDAVEMEISDTGCGIEPANLKKIFQPFFTTKANEKSPSQHSGSGLGLFFVKRVVDDHGGCVSVESKPASGTTFKITLPKPQ